MADFKQSLFNVADGVKEVLGAQKQDKITFPNDASQYLNGAGSFSKPPDHTYSKVSTASDGLAPKLPGSATTYLNGNGEYTTPPNTTYGAVSDSANGLMTPEQKKKLDGIDVSVLSGVKVGRPLDQYTWNELIELSADAKTNPSKYEYLIGQSLHLPITGTTGARCWLMDIGADVDKNGKKCGFEFLISPYPYSNLPALSQSVVCGLYNIQPFMCDYVPWDYNHALHNASSCATGYEGLSIRSWLANEFFAMLPAELQRSITPVKKYGQYLVTSTTGTYEVFDKIWMLSASEVSCGGATVGTTKAPVDEGSPKALFTRVFSSSKKATFILALMGSSSTSANTAGVNFRTRSFYSSTNSVSVAQDGTLQTSLQLSWTNYPTPLGFAL